MTDLVSYRLDTKIAVITLDDGKANALSREMIAALLSALTRAEREASAIVLAGRPERFCAGFDLRVMMSGPAAATEMLRLGSELLLALYATPLPLVIACTGHALAGGALVVLTGDQRIGAAGPYKIGLNEVAIGLPVPLLAMEFARARLAPTELHHATTGARIYDPDAAAAAGYLDAVTAPDDVTPRAIAEATRLAGYSSMAFRGTKARLRGQTLDYIRAHMDEDMRMLLPAS